MTFFKNAESKKIYFSPIFTKQGDSNCFGKLCIVSPLAQRISYLLPFVALIIILLFGVLVSLIFIPAFAPASLDLGEANVWVMTLSLFPGGCTTALVIFCQLPSLKSGDYYQLDHGAIEIHRLLSISTYVIYAFMLAILGIGYAWLHKNPRYDSEEMPFFPAIMVIIASLSVYMWSRLAWVCRKWRCPKILWTPGPHF